LDSQQSLKFEALKDRALVGDFCQMEEIYFLLQVEIKADWIPMGTKEGASCVVPFVHNYKLGEVTVSL